ncbi:MAG TPA: class II aldolase/adducin family protein [Desulfotomaculum sp.]|nr:MAG: aldolase [Peptococcaceae bacterium BRH_c8a]KJS76428.1 MAG: aldolase [Desulfotomaculum sp. BICA1-6]HBX22379.1 class II aldolase/adducin family protein [Desulfotomaculum sp.]
MSLAVEIMREQIQTTGGLMAASGLVTGTSGNISARVPGEHFYVVTPSGIPYDKIKKQDLVVVDGSGHVISSERRPSTELKMHLAIYNAREDIGAIVHTHSTYACALAVAGKSLPPILEEMVQLVGGAVPVARYARAGTVHLAAAAVEVLGASNAVLLANHGLVGMGRDLDEAYQVCLVVEKAAQVYAMAAMMGRVEVISPEDVQTLRHQFLHEYGQPKE